MADENMKALRWNWDAPLIISPHNHKRLYFAANQLFRSDNMGDENGNVSAQTCQEE